MYRYIYVFIYNIDVVIVIMYKTIESKTDLRTTCI